MTPGAPSHQYDTLDQIIAKAIRAALDECAETNEIEIAEHHRDYLTNWATEFTRDALLAEGRIELTRFARGSMPTEHSLVIPLLVGVGCGNAKKDTP